MLYFFSSGNKTKKSTIERNLNFEKKERKWCDFCRAFRKYNLMCSLESHITWMCE